MDRAKTRSAREGLKQFRRELGEAIRSCLEDGDSTTAAFHTAIGLDGNNYWLSRLMSDGTAEPTLDTAIINEAAAIAGPDQPSALRLRRLFEIYTAIVNEGDLATEVAVELVLRAADIDGEIDHTTYQPAELPDPPTQTELVIGKNSCDALVLTLLWRAAQSGTPPGQIFINCEAFDRPPTNPDPGDNLQPVLRELLGAGWKVTQFIRQTSTETRDEVKRLVNEVVQKVTQHTLEDHDIDIDDLLAGAEGLHLDRIGADAVEQTAQLVANLLSMLDAGTYTPLPLHRRHADQLGGTVLVEGIGAVRFATRDVAFFLPWTDKLCRDSDLQAGDVLLVAAEGIVKEAKKDGTHLVIEYAAREDPPADRSEDWLPAPSAGLLQFDEAFTQAETSPGVRYLMKPGPSVTTMPPTSSRKQFHAWYQRAGGDEPIYLKFEENRQRRWDAMVNEHNGARMYRDIGTVESYEQYLKVGSLGLEVDEMPVMSVPLYTGGLLDLPDRIAQFEQIIHLLRSPDHDYQLALPNQEEEVLFSVSPTYWGAAVPAQGEPRVFFFSLDRSGRGLAGEINDPLLAEGFAALFRIVWFTLPEECRDPKKVAGRLESMIEAVRPEQP